MILDLFRKEIGFENIQGYGDIKDIVIRAIDAKDNYNLLFIGPPASAKTLFLLGILESKKGVYFETNETRLIIHKLPKGTIFSCNNPRFYQWSFSYCFFYCLIA